MLKSNVTRKEKKEVNTQYKPVVIHDSPNSSCHSFIRCFPFSKPTDSIEENPWFTNFAPRI